MIQLILASTKTLPSVLLPAYDLAIALRDNGVAMIGGFHAPLERECLEILLRGSQPVTIFPARTFDPANGSLYRKYPKLHTAVKQGITDGRVSIVEPPGMVGSRITRANSVKRNEWLLEQADEVLLLYASPGGDTDRVVQLALARGMPVKLLDHPANARWLELGANVWS